MLHYDGYYEVNSETFIMKNCPTFKGYFYYELLR